MSSLALKTFMTAGISTSSLFATRDLPQEERAEILAQYLSPQPGHEITVDSESLVHRNPSDHIGMVSGTIYIQPPRGHCFYVLQRPDEPEQKICKKTAVPWRLEDLEENGSLSIQIKTTIDELATKVTWPTSYRRVLVVKVPELPDSTREVKFSSKCEILADNKFRRTISLHVLPDEKWIYNFPQYDKLLPQPPPKKNLNVVFDTGKREISSSHKAAAFKAGQARDAVDEETGIDRSFNERVDRKVWHIPRRDAYGMDVHRFQPGGSPPPGMKGFCRYTFQGSPGDPDTGRVECRHGDIYSFAYARLTCLSQVGPRKRKKKL